MAMALFCVLFPGSPKRPRGIPYAQSPTEWAYVLLLGWSRPRSAFLAFSAPRNHIYLLKVNVMLQLIRTQIFGL